MTAISLTRVKNKKTLKEVHGGCLRPILRVQLPKFKIGLRSKISVTVITTNLMLVITVEYPSNKTRI